MGNIQPGFYKVSEILDAAGFDFRAKAGVDYNSDGVDYRRVQIGGVPFGNLDELIRIPTTTDEVVITVDGKTDTVLDVSLTEAHKEERAASFEAAADTNGPAKRVVVEPVE